MQLEATQAQARDSRPRPETDIKTETQDRDRDRDPQPKTAPKTQRPKTKARHTVSLTLTVNVRAIEPSQRHTQLKIQLDIATHTHTLTHARSGRLWHTQDSRPACICLCGSAPTRQTTEIDWLAWLTRLNLSQSQVNRVREEPVLVCPYPGIYNTYIHISFSSPDRQAC